MMKALYRTAKFHGYLGNILLASAALAVRTPQPFPPIKARNNVAKGRPVVFAPAPNYRLTVRGNTDGSDLTDGRFTQRKDLHMWFESRAVGWSYPGRVNLALDLGRQCRIDEIAVRFLGGSPQHGISFPGWVEAFVSRDGEHYWKVAECSRWNPLDFERYGIPEEHGKAWVHCLRFQDIRTTAHWVGIRFYGGGVTCADELFVFGQPSAARVENEAPQGDGATPTRDSPSGFTVRHPQPYLHKPYVPVLAGVPAPLPVGLVCPGPVESHEPLVLELEFPEDLVLDGGKIGKVTADAARCRKTADGTTRYTFDMRNLRTNKTWGRLFLHARSADAGRQRFRLRWRFRNWQSPWISAPIKVETATPAPRLKRILTCLGWWGASDSVAWPDVLDSWQRIGLNGFPLFSHWMPKNPDAPEWRLLDMARKRGFFIVNIDSPFHRMLARHKKEAEIYCQFPDGKHGSHLCPSYRGRFYREEIARLAKECAGVRPDFMSLDIELWSWRGPVDSRKCTRCKQDFARSGLQDWQAWQESKGYEMWTDLITAVQKAVSAVGGNAVDVGGYDFRPGSAYQFTWPFDRLYPRFLMESQVSTYTCLYPYHLEVIGDEVRKDREKLPRSDVLPWITPGDAGTFPGEAFQWALLECFCNGARGVYFWSGRVWDAGLLAAFNRVVRAVAPLEDVIVDGRPITDEEADISAPFRISGMRLGNRMLLLVANYYRRAAKNPGRLRLHLDATSSIIRDMLHDRTLARNLPAGVADVPIPMNRQRAVLLAVTPAP